MNFDVIIPFWPDEEGHRRRLYNWVHDRWLHLYGEDLKMITASGWPCDPFNRARARNDGASSAKTNVLVFADADTIPIKEYVDEAVAIAADGHWAIAYGKDRYYNLTEDATEVYLDKDPWVEIVEPGEGEYEHKVTSFSGIIAVPREAFGRIGGYDERFEGWGWEDNAFQITLDRRWGKHVRVDGFVNHLWHPRGEASFDTPGELANRALFQKEYRR